MEIMKLTRSLLALSLLGIVPLSSCKTGSASFVDQSLGYAVARGQLVQVSDLTAEKTTQLSDGVAIEVMGKDCKVVMDFGQGQQSIPLLDKSIIVYGDTTDYVLQPYDVTPQLKIPTPQMSTLDVAPED